ncbi:MAG: T9SS type A sorting domain-containing protein [Ignavibacteriaceae bacterium]|nr:T9SS type A sorting domain-containing protein [Ignavibacteriaceae bacterium]
MEAEGTDHGTAAPLFIIGRNVFGGVYGNNPDLADLDNNGDIKFKYDFRQLYATLLTQQLGMPIERMPEVLMRDFDTLPLISEKAGNLSGPSVFHLEQNYPNPFNPATTISYYLRIPQAVRLDIFSSAGDKVATLVNAYQETGNYEVQFDGRSYSSGVYFARLDTGGTSKTIKMMMIK